MHRPTATRGAVQRLVHKPWLGALLSLGSLAALAILGAMVKGLGERYPVAELLFFRFGFAVIFLLGFLPRAGGARALATGRPLDHALRAGFGVTGLTCYFVALTSIPLAEATALFFAAPIFVTALSPLLLGERIGRWRWAAVVAGFAGVIVIVNPGGVTWQIGTVAGVGSALFGALVNIWLRRLSRTEATVTIALYYNTTGVVLCGLWLGTFGWVAPLGDDWLWLVALGLVGGLGQYLMTASFRFAEASILAPLEYLSLIFAAGLGYLIWQEVPSWRTWAGALVIVASGLFVIYRESRLAARNRQPSSGQSCSLARDERP